jgi:hypothetical protein
MKLRTAVTLLYLIPPALLLHAKDKKPDGVPAVFGQARYVYVEATDGTEFDPNLNTEDRTAIADVRDAMAKWKRYTEVTSKDEADLVIVVRKGRLASANAGITPQPGQLPNGRPGQLPSGSNRQGGIGTGEYGSEVGVEAGPPEDLFEVCAMNPDGKLSGPLWLRTMPDGLRAPRVTLLEQFRDAVDKAYPPQPAGSTKTQQTQPPAQQPPPQQPPVPGQKP